MKFSKKLSLLLGASKAMKVEKDDNASVKDSDKNPATEVENNLTNQLLMTKRNPPLFKMRSKKKM